MFSFLKRLLRPKPPTHPEHAWRVWNSNLALHCAYRAEEKTVGWDALTEIAIVTTDEGPLLPDVFWRFRSGTEELVFPQMALGEQEIVDRAMKLPGFDFDASSRAMSSAVNAEFVVWKKNADPVGTDNERASPARV